MTTEGTEVRKETVQSAFLQGRILDEYADRLRLSTPAVVDGEYKLEAAKLDDTDCGGSCTCCEGTKPKPKPKPKPRPGPKPTKKSWYQPPSQSL
jgi:hypothetical protein